MAWQSPAKKTVEDTFVAKQQVEQVCDGAAVCQTDGHGQAEEIADSEDTHTHQPVDHHRAQAVAEHDDQHQVGVRRLALQA